MVEAEPLRRGGSHCMFHATWFCTKPAQPANALLVFFDLETTGLSLATDSIVEMGLLDDRSQAVYSTVVCPPRLSNAPGIHGIESSELLEGADFAQAFDRMTLFLESCARIAIDTDSDSSQERSCSTSFCEEVPDVVLVAHNGLRFDFPMLASECRRHGVSWSALAQWRYVDTLEILHAMTRGEAGECLKLQCLARKCCAGLRAHRALDDAIALRTVLVHLAERLGLNLPQLIRPFVKEMDAATTAAHLTVLLDST
jgi:DNA polymerase III epsilon subunit-like protein